MFTHAELETRQLISRKSATEFLNNKRSHTLFQTSFFLKVYENPYVKPQPNNEKFTKRGRQQQLLTCNTPSSKGYS